MAKAQSEMAKIQADLEKIRSKAAVDIERMNQQERIESARIAAKMASDNMKADSQKEIEGFKSGFNLVRDLIDE